MTELKAIFARIEQRLKETGQNPTAASKAAGKPDAIRNIQRAVEEGGEGSIKLDTLLSIAKQLETDPAWLIFGGDKSDAAKSVSDKTLKPYLDAMHSVLLMMVKDPEEADALLGIVISAAVEPPTPSAGADRHKIVAEIEARRFLNSKQSGRDGA